MSPVLAAETLLETRSFGMAIADGAGQLLAANRSFAEMLAPDRGDLLGLTCCELLGCRLPGGRLAHFCLTELTRSVGALSKVKVGLPVASLAGSAWVTTSLVDGHCARVLIEVQPTEAEALKAPPAPRLAVLTLGRTRVEDEAGSLGGAWLEQRPAQLLKFLITERHRVVPVEEIAEALWLNGQMQTLSSVRQCVHALRERLEPGRPRRTASSFIAAHRGGYALLPERFWIDADQFERLVTSGLSLFEVGSPDLAAQHLEQGLALYHGDFLSDEPYAEWAFAERNRLVDVASSGLRALSVIQLCAHDYEAAARSLERLAKIDRYDIAVQRELITLCIKRDRLSEARRRYQMLRSRLMRDFGEEPGFALTDARDTKLTGERLLPKLISSRATI